MTKDELRELIEGELEVSGTFGAVSFEVDNKLKMQLSPLKAGIEISLWDQKDRSAGTYSYPAEFDLLAGNVDWLLASAEHSVCCECKKQLDGAGNWRPFVGNYCDDCDKKVPHDDMEDTDWWN